MFGWNKKVEEAQRPLKDLVCDVLHDALVSNKYTPDILQLRNKAFHPIFVYGTQMRGHPQHALVSEHSAYQGVGFTGQNFTLWKKTLAEESYPIAIEGSGWKMPSWNVPVRGKVCGEIYWIETSQLERLDEHYQNTLEFERKRIPIIVPYTELYKIPAVVSDLQKQVNKSLGIDDKDSLVVTTQKKIHMIRCWMYIGKNEYWTEQLGRFFSPVQMYKPNQGWLGNYYEFTKQEYKPDFKPTALDEGRSFDWREYRPPVKEKEIEQ